MIYCNVCLLQPSLAEKKTLEIAHTFLDEGETTPAVKLRGLDTAAPCITVRRVDSGRGYPRNSPAAHVRTCAVEQ